MLFAKSGRSCFELPMMTQTFLGPIRLFNANPQTRFNILRQSQDTSLTHRCTHKFKKAGTVFGNVLLQFNGVVSCRFFCLFQSFHFFHHYWRCFHNKDKQILLEDYNTIFELRFERMYLNTEPDACVIYIYLYES